MVHAHLLTEPDFYLFLTEDRDALQPRACRVRGTLRSSPPDGRLTVVDLEPPVPAGLCGTERDLARVLLAPRRRDVPLENVLDGDVPVILCVPKSGTIDLAAPGVLARELCNREWGKIRLTAKG